MALSASTVWEIRTAGADTNGGGYVTGSSGTDYSQNNTKRTATGTDDSTTDAVANGTTTITSATASFGTTIVGNIIYLQGGTGGLAAGWYQVATRTNATTITVDRTVAAGTGITMNIGGALGSPGMVGGTGIVSNNYVWIKAGTYTVTSASTNVSNGCINFSTATVYVEGYNSSRGDMGTKPLIQADGVITAFTFISMGNNGNQWVRNIKFDGNNRTTSRGISLRGTVLYCEFVNFTNSAIADTIGLSTLAFNCSATGCATNAAFTGVTCVDCVAFDNTITGFSASAIDCNFIRCIADSNSGAASDGFLTSASSERVNFYNCVAYNNGRHGFFVGGLRDNFFINCIAETNAGTGFIHNGNNQLGLYNCAYYNNGTNVTLGTNVGSFNVGAITGTGSFFTNAASQDFTLNNTASAGAAARAAGIPGTITGLATPVGYLDLGVYQHQDTGGGGGEFSSVF